MLIKKCNGYSKECFECIESISNYCVASIGEGMDIKMLSEIGERKLAINCPSQKGILILNLNNEQIKEMTCGKLEKISEEYAKEGLINSDLIKNYLIKNTDKIDWEVIGPCNVLPPYP